MKYLYSSYALTSILIAAIFAVGYWFVTPILATKESIFSPVPEFLTLSRDNQVSTLDLFLPLLEKMSMGESGQILSNAITAKSALTFDLTSNNALFNKNIHERIPMASLTKIMTAIVAMEHPKADDTYYVPRAALVGEDSMGLSAGETLTLHELLYGLVLNSGNDAAEVLAQNYPAGRAAFIQAMNEKAISLGLTDTHFTNPSGLQGEGDQHTTAYDLLVITRYALNNFPVFADVARTIEHHMPATTTHKAYDLYNETNLMTTYPGVAGVKTGYTPEAGLCLITLLNYNGHEILGVLLGSENRRLEMVSLLDHSLSALGIKPPQHSI